MNADEALMMTANSPEMKAEQRGGARSRGLILGALALVVGAFIFGVGAFAFNAGSIALKESAENASSPKTTTAADLRREGFAAEEAYARAPNAKTLRRLVAAAYAAGDFEAVLRLAMDPEAPFADAVARRSAEGEARLRLRQYDLAADAASFDAADASAILLFVRARARYAASPSDPTGIAELLRAAFGADNALSGEAWLFRARLALDSNDVATARAAANRAREAGVDFRRVEAVGIEATIRSGDLAAANAMLRAREKLISSQIDYDGLKLEGMLAFREGRYQAAVQAFDRIAGWLEMEPRGDLLRAAAKSAAGDTAQAVSIAATYRQIAPDDWVAADISLVVDRDASLDAVRRLNPSLAAARQFVLSRRGGDIDAAVGALDDFAINLDARHARQNTGLEFLFGPAAGHAAAGGDRTAPQPADWRALAASSAAKSMSVSSLLSEAETFDAEPEDAIDRLVAARLFIRAGRIERGIAALRLAIDDAPGSIFMITELAATEARFGSPATASFLRQIALTENPHWLPVRIDLALSLEASGRWSAALRVLLDGAPDTLVDDETAPMLARIAVELGRDDVLDRLRAHTTGITSLHVRAETLLSLKEFDAAADIYRQILIFTPTDRVAASGYFEAMSSTGQEQQARAFLRLLADRNPEMAPMINNLSVNPRRPS